MKFTVKNVVPPKAQQDTTAGHDDDQHEITLIGDDLTALKEVGTIEDGQPSAATESLEAQTPTDCGGDQGQCSQRPMCVSRVIGTDNSQRIHVVLGFAERTKWLATVIGIMDSASEKDTIDITITDCPLLDNVYSTRSLLSAIDRCRATVITHAGALTTLGDIALWLSGDQLKWSKHMSVVFVRQQGFGFGGDIRDYVGKAQNAYDSFREFRDFIAARGLFTGEELDHMYETRGMLSLFGRELEARVNGLKEVA